MTEVQLFVYDVYFDDEEGFVDRVRVYAEDEYHAEQRALALYHMPNGAREVEYRGEAY